MWKLLLVLLIGCTLVPVPFALDIRGWQEMHPLNGPGWSLFFEYVANILYGLFIRNFSKRALSILVVLSGAALIHLAVTSPNGDVIGGWSLDPAQLRIGFTRVMYPFFAGLLLFRVGMLGQVKNAFLWSSLLILLVVATPRIGGAEHLWMNGLYDSLSIIFLFPLIIYIGASGTVQGRQTERICKFLGEISYPIYITHFPFIYLYTAWVSNHKPTLAQAWPMALLVMVSSIVFAYLCLKFYDEPVRKWLKRR
jgi:peptidoglycan/LPS O-acetylase OafA/YrhL